VRLSAQAIFGLITIPEAIHLFAALFSLTGFFDIFAFGETFLSVSECDDV
jgi:hypothetical protein